MSLATVSAFCSSMRNVWLCCFPTQQMNHSTFLLDFYAAYKEHQINIFWIFYMVWREKFYAAMMLVVYTNNWSNKNECEVVHLLILMRLHHFMFVWLKLRGDICKAICLWQSYYIKYMIKSHYFIGRSYLSLYHIKFMHTFFLSSFTIHVDLAYHFFNYWF